MLKSLLLVLNLVFANTTLQTNEYIKKFIELRNFETKIHEAEEQYHLLKKSGTAGSSPELMKQLVTSHKQLEELVQKYNELRAEVKYKFPGQGREVEERFTKKTIKSDSNEGAVSLVEKMEQTKKLVDQKYAPFTRVPASEKSAEPIERRVLRLEK